MTIRKLLAAGRDADVFALDDRRVLRRYRDGADATAEAAVMIHVGRLGYPVPAIHSVAGAEMVLERLHGPTMLEALAGGRIGPDVAGRALADLQTRLHALPPRTSPDSRERIRHGDLHPANIVLTAGGPVVIDWRNATEGPAELDVALSAVIAAQIALDPAESLAATARAFLAAFLAHARLDARTMLAEAAAARRADANQSEAELVRLAEAVALIRSLAPGH